MSEINLDFFTIDVNLMNLTLVRNDAKKKTAVLDVSPSLEQQQIANTGNLSCYNSSPYVLADKLSVSLALRQQYKRFF